MKTLCVAPDGRLELWARRKVKDLSEEVWEIATDVLEKSEFVSEWTLAYALHSWTWGPEFWGREVLEEWDA